MAGNLPIEDKSQLVEYFETSSKPRAQFRLGLEQEMFVCRKAADLRPAAYEGPEPGIRALLEGMTRFGWESVRENGFPIALAKGLITITLEPGGQVELSGTPLDNAHDTEAETRACHRQLASVADELGLCFMAIGHQPKWPRSEVPWMPKERYRIMRAYMAKQGTLGLTMMQSTCALQLNVDFCSEADMAKKFRVSLALSPFVTALFANSPFLEGWLSGYLSYRSHVWNHTDDDRCGSPRFVFEEEMSFERYTDYALDVPMYFVLRNGEYIDASGMSFRDFLEGRLPVLPGELPTLGDWENHLGTLFPDVRLKRHLEFRGADAGGSGPRGTALAALSAGLLYDASSLDAAWETVRGFTREERSRLSQETPIYGFQTPFRGGTIRALCLRLLGLSREGLRRRAHQDSLGRDESIYLDPLQEAAEAGETFAEQLIHRFDHEWRQDMDAAMKTLSEETMA